MTLFLFALACAGGDPDPDAGSDSTDTTPSPTDTTPEPTDTPPVPTDDPPVPTDTPPTETGTPPTETGTPPPPPTGPLSYDTDVRPIFEAACVNCHMNGETSGSLDLDLGVDALVDVASVDLPSMVRVRPTKSENSYLWHKLEGTHIDAGGSGVKMPKGGSLTPTELTTVKGWIESGAGP